MSSRSHAFVTWQRVCREEESFKAESLSRNSEQAKKSRRVFMLAFEETFESETLEGGRIGDPGIPGGEG